MSLPTAEHAPPLRWGVIGYGGHAERKMHPAFDKTPRATLDAIATRSEIKADALRLRFPQIRIYRTYEELLTDPVIDAVYIGLPNHLHAEWTIRALETGKHVLCDKPLGISEAEAREVLAAARRSKRQYMEGFMYRFHPQHQRVKELVAQNRIGRVHLFEAHFHFLMNDFGNIRLQPESAGGGLLDVGCYLVDSTRFILGKMPRSVTAIWQIGEESKVDEFLTCQLEYDDALVAHLTCGCRFGWGNQYTLYGTEGKLTLHSAYTIPWNKQGRIEEQLTGDSVTTYLVPACNYFAEELTCFAKRVAGEPVDESLFGDGIENLRILDAIRESASTGRKILLES